MPLGPAGPTKEGGLVKSKTAEFSSESPRPLTNSRYSPGIIAGVNAHVISVGLPNVHLLVMSVGPKKTLSPALKPWPFIVKRVCDESSCTVKITTCESSAEAGAAAVASSRLDQTKDRRQDVCRFHHCPLNYDRLFAYPPLPSVSMASLHLEPAPGFAPVTPVTYDSPVCALAGLPSGTAARQAGVSYAINGEQIKAVF